MSNDVTTTLNHHLEILFSPIDTILRLGPVLYCLIILFQSRSCTNWAWNAFYSVQKLVHKQVRMYYGSGTGRCCCIWTRQCTHQMAALLCIKWRLDRHLEIMTSYQKYDSINRCIFTWRTMLPNFILIRFELTELIWKVHPNKKKNKMSCDMRFDS